VDLDGVVAHTRALGRIGRVALHHEAELDLAAPALVDVDAVVADVPDRDVLEVDGAAPDLDAVIDVVHDLDVVDVGVLADAAQRQAVELRAEADDAAAVAQRHVAQRAAVVEVVPAAVAGAGVGRAGGDQALH
ncbi:MAG: hypothetical protein ACK55I_42900, partial [bacterium]